MVQPSIRARQPARGLPLTASEGLCRGALAAPDRDCSNFAAAPVETRLRRRISVFVLGTFASLGGLGYAASGATGTYGAVKQVAVKHTLIVSVHKSSAADEYAPKPKPKPHKKKVKPVHQTGVAGAQTGVGIAGVKTSGTLPFTGLSLLATLVLSMALLVAGIILRRRERRN